MRAALEKQGRAPATISEYETALKRVRDFEKTMESGQLPLEEWTPILLHAFRWWLISTGLSELRADKTVGSAQQVLSHAAKSWVVERAPAISVKRTSVGKRFTFSLPELRSLYRAAESAEWPTHTREHASVDPATWWRLYLVLSICTAARTQDIWRYERSHKAVPLQWKDLHSGTDGEIFGRAYSHDLGWLRIRHAKTHKELALPLSREAREWLFRTRTVGLNADKPIFDFPYTKSPHDGFYAAWWRIVAEAGLTPQRNADGAAETHRPIDLRRTSATLHNAAIGADAAFITGHAWPSSDLFHRHYVVPVERMIESMNALPRLGE